MFGNQISFYWPLGIYGRFYAGITIRWQGADDTVCYTIRNESQVVDFIHETFKIELICCLLRESF